MNRKELIIKCLKSLHKDESDETALSVCTCQVDKVDRHFSNKQYRDHTIGKEINLPGMLKEDSLLEKNIQSCFTNTGKSILIEAESFETGFVENCIRSLQKSTEKKLDINRLTNFCTCQLELVKTKKLSDLEMRTASNPNSLLFYEIVYKCGDPFVTGDSIESNWNQKMAKDVAGPITDTIRTLSLNGMTYVKVKIGSMTQVWLFDTGASDLLINKEMEEKLKIENIITPSGYLGVAEYEMANGVIDTCRRYKIDNVKIGSFSINNIIVAVTDKGKRIIVGKGLLNKFSNWKINNADNTLILTK